MGASPRRSRADLEAAIVALEALVAALQARVADLEAETAALRAGAARKGDPPPWVKPKTPPRPPTVRKRRGRGYGRACVATPDRVVTQALDVCPDCGGPLTAAGVASRREVVDLLPPAVEVTHYVRLRHRCRQCGRRVAPPPDAGPGGGPGRRRFGPRLLAWVAYAHTTLRLPFRQIQEALAQQAGLPIAVGSLGNALDTVAAQGAAAADALRAGVTAAPYVHVDETGWREDGQHGYVWGFVTPDTCYFVRAPSRASHVPRDVLGAEYPGIVVADGYSGYSALASQKQRCWVHVLRHGHDLTTRYPDARAAHRWVQRLRALYERARARVAQPRFCARREDLRAQTRQVFAAALVQLAAPCQEAPLPEWARLARFLVAHAHELFVFVQHPAVPSDNNAAERALRPPVTARKISGGTRSPAGSARRMRLFSLLQTAKVRGLAPLPTLMHLLAGQPFPAPARASP